LVASKYAEFVGYSKLVQYWAGSPAKYVRDLTEEELTAAKNLRSSLEDLSGKHYQYRMFVFDAL
jgi:hypothetical protein